MLYLLFILLCAVLAIRRRKLKRLIELSNQLKCGVKSYPLIGHSYLFKGGGANRMQAFQRLGREALKNGGMTNMWIGANYYVVVVDPEDIEVIMKTSLEKDNIMRFARNLIGNGVIFAPVSIWHPRRKIMAPTFRSNNLNSFVDVFARHSNILVEQLDTVAENSVTSVWKFLSNYALDAVCAPESWWSHTSWAYNVNCSTTTPELLFETTLDINLNSQRNSAVPFLKSFEVCCKLIAARMVQPWLHLDSIYKLLPYHTDFVKHKGVVCDFVDEAIRAKRKELLENNGKENNESDTKSFLELLITSSGTDRGYSDLELHEETLVIIVAGTDTSTTAVSFISVMLAKYPDIQEKVYQELQEVFDGSDRPVTAADLPRLKYLDAVVKETLRLYPPVPVIVRHIEKDIELPSGVTLVEGCGVLINIWAIHRNPLYWGDDAEEFKPERFIDTPLKHPYAYLAFSNGPRGCIGYRYAMMLMKSALATFIRRYKLINADDGNKCDEPLKVTFEVMMKDVNGFKVKLQKRDKP